MMGISRPRRAARAAA